MEMIQHILVTLVFAVCLYWVVRSIARIVSSARKGESRCDTCTETTCPLRNATRTKDDGCNCGCGCSASKSCK